MILDCTLRDGGFKSDFNWSDRFVNEYLNTINHVKEIQIVEYGYYLQTEKSKNKYYNLNLNDIDNLNTKNKKKSSVIIDYHYCTKDIDAYIELAEAVDLLRITLRKDLIYTGLKWIEKLVNRSNLNISINIFNISNYTPNELIHTIETINKLDIKYLYFADTHGAVIEPNTFSLLSWYASKISKYGLGMHLHNHQDQAFFLFKLCEKYFDIVDATITGIGKGGGNLKTECILSQPSQILLSKHIYNNIDTYAIDKSKILSFITSIYSISDNYSIYYDNDIEKFIKMCSSVEGENKDNYKNI